VTAQISAYSGQLKFADTERAGVAEAGPLLDLTAAAAHCRLGRGCDLATSVGRLQAANAANRNALGTADDVAALGAAASAPDADPDAVMTQALALMSTVGSASNLLLDPELDSYNVMDAATTRATAAYDVASHGTILASAVHRREGGITARLDLAALADQLATATSIARADIAGALETERGGRLGEPLREHLAALDHLDATAEQLRAVADDPSATPAVRGRGTAGSRRAGRDPGHGAGWHAGRADRHAERAAQSSGGDHRYRADPGRLPVPRVPHLHSR
jgi:hypothetical protein